MAIPTLAQMAQTSVSMRSLVKRLEMVDYFTLSFALFQISLSLFNNLNIISCLIMFLVVFGFQFRRRSESAAPVELQGTPADPRPPCIIQRHSHHFSIHPTLKS